jgi:ABC-2 type transport system ATP-binding protein
MDLAIEIKNLVKSFPGRIALEDVSFSVKKGSVHGFLGPNGAGKSTTMKIICGLLTQNSGEVTLSGSIGFLPEHPPLYPMMTVFDYLTFILEIYSFEKNVKKVEEVITKTGLDSVRERLIGNLSKGYQQRVGIAQAIIHSPEIIILDEPTVGLDPVAISEIRNLISELKKEHTILFSSHQLHDVELLCSDITLIQEGKIVVSGSLEDILLNLKKNRVQKARVKKFNESLAQSLMNELGNYGKIHITFDQDATAEDFHLKIQTQGHQDLRVELSRFLSRPEIGLLEFFEDKGELEDLFKRMDS